MKNYIGVIGTGIMGSGMATILIGYHFKTIICSRNTAECKRGNNSVVSNFKYLKKTNLVTDEQTKEALEHLQVTYNYSDLSKCNIIIEAVTEDVNTKREVYKKLEEVCHPETVFISVTSALSADILAEGLKNKQRLIVGHTWNPPYLIPLVEIVKSRFTNKKTEIETIRLFNELEMEEVILSKSIDGFIGNRIQHAMFREALYLLDKGICSPEDIDKVILNTIGPRYANIGLMEYYDFVGLDLQYKIESFLFKSLCNAKKPQKYLTDRYREGNLGAKTGQGIYDWTKKDYNNFMERKNRAFNHIRCNWGYRIKK